MAAEGSTHPAGVVATAFAKEYYKYLTRSPQLLFRFYKEGSKLSRLDNRGEMTSVTGVDAINEKLLSVDYSDYSAEIKTVDAQESLNGGVAVLVSGYLKRKFAQSFFLATQEKGYYVLNDIFRLLDEANDQPSSSASTSRDAVQLEQQENVVPEEEKLDEVETIDPSAEISWSVKEEVQAGKEIDEVSKSLQAVTLNPSSSTTLEESTPSKSFTSIVSPSDIKYTGLLASPTSLPAFGTEYAYVSPNAAYSYTSPEPESFGYSIHIKNLPLDVTPAQLQEEFMKFGPIKPDGIQILYYKQGQRCFGFVHFEVADAVARAIEASPVIIGGQPTFVEKKTSTNSAASNRGRHRYPSIRGRRNYGARRRVFDRGEDSSRTDFGHGGGSRSGGG